MVDKKQQATNEDPEVVIESALNRTEEFIRVHGKKLLIALGAVVVIVGGIFAYKYMYRIPRQEKAAAAMFTAQQAFLTNAYDLALNGDGANQGFLQVIGKYGSTPSGNLARHYAGQCYLRLGKFDEAIAQFDKYSKVKGVPAQLVNAMNEGLKGDAYVEKGDLRKGVQQYQEAVKTSDNEFTAPYYSLKAGITYMELGDYRKAMDMFENVKFNYPASNEAAEIEKYIGQAQQKL